MGVPAVESKARKSIPPILFRANQSLLSALLSDNAVIAPFRYPREVDADVAVHEFMNKHLSIPVESTEPMKDPCIGCDKSWIDDSGWKCKYECQMRFAYLYNLMNN